MDKVEEILNGMSRNELADFLSDPRKAHGMLKAWSPSEVDMTPVALNLTLSPLESFSYTSSVPDRKVGVTTSVRISCEVPFVITLEAIMDGKTMYSVTGLPAEIDQELYTWWVAEHYAKYTITNTDAVFTCRFMLGAFGSWLSTRLWEIIRNKLKELGQQFVSGKEAEFV